MLEAEFYRGNYTKILATTVDSADGRVPAVDAAFVIGALTFRGRLDEAEATFRLFLDSMDEEARFMARFFLGVGLCRHSHHARGRALLAQNLRAGARHSQARIRFYAWQGVGYYRLVCCRVADALRHAARALNAALAANFLYGKALAGDLMAHSQVGPGQIQAAGESFRRALYYAELLGDGGLRQAIQVSLVIHSAQHGLNPAGDIASLEAACAQLNLEDNYSKARLLLELGRQHLLRGHVARAKACLDDACRLVYASQNSRYGIILNLRYAFIMHLAGEHHQALNLLRNAAKALDPLVDRQVAAEVLGLTIRLLGFVTCPSLDAERHETSRRLSELTRLMGCSVNVRMLERAEFGGYSRRALVGDDPLGDLADAAASRRPDTIPRLVESGYLLLLATKLGIAPGSTGLVIDLLPGALLAYDRGEMHVVSAGISHAIRTLLRCLTSGNGSKEALIHSIWRYKYHPLKHDQLIYTAISRLRQLLGPYANWVEVTESGYRLRDSLTVQFLGTDFAGGPSVDLTTEVKDTESDAPAPTTEAWAGATTLNYRQIGIVELLKEQSFVDVRTCSERFQVSEVSARRDLSLLTQLGVLCRHGKGRATRYSLPQGKTH